MAGTVDVYNIGHLRRRIESYLTTEETRRQINTELLAADPNHSQIRRENFPSDVSENFVKFLYRSRGNNVFWNTTTGDLIEVTENDINKWEVKCFSSQGPNSFGPTEQWKKLVFINACDFNNGNFRIYEVNMSNTDERWRSIPFTSTRTFGDIANSGQRPRIGFEQLRTHLEVLGNDVFQEVFYGTIDDLENL